MFKVKYANKKLESKMNELEQRCKDKEASEVEKIYFEKVQDTINTLKRDPHDNSLHTQMIKNSRNIYGYPVFESYVENDTPGAKRMFWRYNKKKKRIKDTIYILLIIKHPNTPKDYRTLNLHDDLVDEHIKRMFGVDDVLFECLKDCDEFEE